MDTPAIYAVMILEEDVNRAVIWLKNQQIRHYFWQYGYTKNIKKITKFVFWTEEDQVLFALKWA